MTYIILSCLQVILFFTYSIMERFEKIFIYRLAINSIKVYRTTINFNILNNMVDCIKLKVVKSWSI